MVADRSVQCQTSRTEFDLPLLKRSMLELWIGVKAARYFPCTRSSSRLNVGHVPIYNNGKFASCTSLIFLSCVSCTTGVLSCSEGVALVYSGSHSTTSAAPGEQDRTPVVQETLPTVEQDSETVTPLPESAMTHRYPSQTRKPPENSGMYCFFFRGRGM